MLLFIAVLAGAVTSPHPELGIIRWQRGFDVAKADAAREGKPLLVLFDEVPGCATVRGYGSRVLSHPLIRDAIEGHFVNVVVYNNTSGDDRRVLNHFNEPSWNNPAMRIMDAEERLLAPRLYGDYSVQATAKTLVMALQSASRPVPDYLKLLALDARTEVVTYSMYCFWSGESALGGVSGVVETEAGFASGEVVRVRYDPAETDVEELDRAAARAQARRVSSERFRASPKDTKYQIRHSLLRFVPMTESQASRINAALTRRDDPLRYLSPSQRRIYRAVQLSGGAGWSVALGRDFASSYRAADKKARTVLANR